MTKTLATMALAAAASLPPVSAQPQPARESGGVLVVAPHPDDDVIIAAGVVHRANQRQEPVRVVFVTNGDANGAQLGVTRQAEAVAAQGRLGTPEERLIFLGYPDSGLSAIRRGHASAASAFVSEHGKSATYAQRGLGKADYHTHRFGSPAQYNWANMVADLADILTTWRPAHIFTTSQWDTHADHSTTYSLVVEAAKKSAGALRDYNPTIHKTSVWPGDESWPLPADTATFFTPLPRTGVDDPRELVWKERESLDVPSAMQSGFTPANPKYAAVSAHDSQGGVDRYIGRWIHKDEFFWTEQAVGTNRPPVPDAGIDQRVAPGAAVTLDGAASWDRNGGALIHHWRQVLGPKVTLSDPSAPRPTFTAPAGLADQAVLEFELLVSDRSLKSVPDAVRVIVASAAPPVTYGRNVAPLAAFSASSERDGSGQSASKAADGVVDGYPRDSSREWVTAGERNGAWIAMTWKTPVTIGKVSLADRPNSADQVMAGAIEFSDGSTLPVGALSNDGRPVDFTFSPRTVRSLRLTVAEVSRGTENVGLAEFQVYETVGAVPKAETTSRTVNVSPPIAGSGAPPATESKAATVPDGGNIAPSAKVRASTERAPLQAAQKAVDGIAGGYPKDPEHEWTTAAETTGAWIELTWSSPRLVNKVRLRDRPNADDQVRSGTLTFSDGSSVSVGPLSNEGAAVDIEFAPRTIGWMRLTVDAVGPSTVNVGLSEIEVFESSTSRR